MRHNRFEVRPSEDGQWYWRCASANNRTTCTGELHRDAAAAKRAADDHHRTLLGAFLFPDEVEKKLGPHGSVADGWEELPAAMNANVRWHVRTLTLVVPGATEIGCTVDKAGCIVVDAEIGGQAAAHTLAPDSSMRMAQAVIERQKGGS